MTINIKILRYAIANVNKEKEELKGELIKRFKITTNTAYKYIVRAKEETEKQKLIQRLNRIEQLEQEKINRKYARKRTMKFSFDDSKLMQIGR